MSIPFLFLLSNILTFFTGWFVGFFVLIKAYRDAIANSFARVAIALALWALALFFWQMSQASAVALAFSYVHLMLITAVAAMLVDFCTRFVEPIKRVSYREYRTASAIIAMAMMITIGLDWYFRFGWFIDGVAANQWFLLWPVPGYWYQAFFLFPLLATWFCISVVVRAMRYAETIQKMQLWYILISIFVAGSGILSVYLFWYQWQLPPLGGFLVPVIFILMFYVISRLRLLNIKVIATEFLLGLIWLALFFRIVFAVGFGERVFDVTIFLLVVIFGTLVIRSVHNEITQRARAEYLSGQLANANTQLQHFNDNLQQKVSEQTEEIRKAYEVEKKARIELEDLDKAKDQFILTTQHHLRTPLTIVKGFIQTALKRKDQVTGEAAEFLQKASAATDRMNKLINDFLGVSQLEVGKAVFRFQAVDMQALIEEIKQELASEIKKKDLAFVVQFSEKTRSYKAVIDREAIKAALFNLIDNGVKYTSKGGITISADVVMHPIEKTNFIKLIIKDTGIGISREELPKLFDRYFQRGTEAEKMYTSGRGIGLVLAKNIIKAHKGSITVTSPGVGKGSSFIIELPCALL